MHRTAFLRSAFRWRPAVVSSRSKQLSYGLLTAATGLWWLTSTRDEVPSLKGPATELIDKHGPTQQEVTQILAQHAFSIRVKTIAGLSRYDGTQLASNSICEDRCIHGKFPSPRDDGSQWMAWALFDGHAGWQTAELLKEQLVPFVQHGLNEVKSEDTAAVHRAIRQAFVKLDSCIMNMALEALESEAPLPDKIERLVPAFAGSCALLCLYDPATSNLHVACTGDSRAVHGQRFNGKWEATSLSEDQTGSNDSEIARLSEEHPGEEHIVKDGRVLGMMVSRAFGDFRWKLPLEAQAELKRRFYAPALAAEYHVRTPPYLTAEPVVTTTRMAPGRASFLIMATDGMWNMLSNQQAVDLVGKWLDTRHAPQEAITTRSAHESFDFGHFWKGVYWRFVEERTSIQDSNAAVHLVRNALGGNHHEMLAGRLAFGPPFSRPLRDDVTVKVAFFE